MSFVSEHCCAIDAQFDAHLRMVPPTYSRGRDDIAELKMHVSAIAIFLRQHEWLWRSHVVDFFKKKLWAKVDGQWNCCLRVASAENWLLLPSGITKEEWPDSLKEFVQTASQLSLLRGQADKSSNLFCSGVPQAPIGSLLQQGMSVKKRHEIGILAALIAGTAKLCGAKEVIDVGAGQGYLALVLAFEYRLSVIAVDACAHHADVTNKRALCIEKYYNARSRAVQQEGLKHPEVRAPQTVTCRIGTEESSATLSSLLSTLKKSNSSEVLAKERLAEHNETNFAEVKDSGVVLAGLHACGDLSATMLRTFIDCKDVAAVVNVTCCYHLLTEKARDDGDVPGFPMSETVANLGLQLGRSVRELACESADRWKEHHPTKAVQNFELHAFRAAFQLILDRYYPEFASSRPSVGRVGKSRRRRKARQSAMEPLIDTTEENMLDMDPATCSLGTCTISCIWNLQKLPGSSQKGEACDETSRVVDIVANSFELVEDNTSNLISQTDGTFEQQLIRFEEYVSPVLELFNLSPLPALELESVWTEVTPFQDLVGPFYSLRTVLAPVIESYILLDRLLYLKEQAELVAANDARITAALIPIFDPSTSPRNMAIIAHRVGLFSLNSHILNLLIRLNYLASKFFTILWSPTFHTVIKNLSETNTGGTGNNIVSDRLWNKWYSSVQDPK